MNGHFQFAGALVLCTVWATDDVAAQRAGSIAVPMPPASKSLDQKLLDDLGPAPSADPRPPQSIRATSPPAGEDVGQPSSVESRLADIGRRMRHVETLLRGRDASSVVRQLQGEIARDLARLIAEQHGSNGPSDSRQLSSSQPSSSPPRETPTPPSSSTNPGGRGNSGSPAAPLATDVEVRQTAQSVWGDLPDRVRQQIQQLAGEEFLPEFADVIREYYRRLAERASKQR